MDSTKFWEIAGLVLSLVQFLLYLAGFNKYRKRLGSLATELVGRADEQFDAYKTLRDKDPAFYDYYKALPDYKKCDRDSRRTRGTAMNNYGSALRSSLRTVNGYTPLQRISLVNALSVQPINLVGAELTKNEMQERLRVDSHLLNRWQAIVGAPVRPANVSDVSSIIRSSFSSMKSFGKGANSAGISLGKSFYNLRN